MSYSECYWTYFIPDCPKSQVSQPKLLALQWQNACDLDKHNLGSETQAICLLKISEYFRVVHQNLSS